MESSNHAAESSIINEEELLVRWEGNRELVGEVLAGCLEDGALRIAAMKDAVANKDIESAHLQACHIKEIALNAASPVPELLAMEMEFAVTDCDWKKAENLRLRLDAHLKSVKCRLRCSGWIANHEFGNDDSIHVGVPAIDEQHRAIFSALRALEECGDDEGGRERAVIVIKALMGCVQIHFQEEEDFMKAQLHPGLEWHMQEHNIFIAHIRMMLGENGIGEKLTGAELSPLLAAWQRDHIMKMDRAYAP